MRVEPMFLAPFLAALLACSSTSTGTGKALTESSATGGSTSASSGTASATSSSNSSGFPACTWPANLNPPQQDGGPPPWGVARTFLKCNDGPDFALCLSNDPTTCPGPNAVVGGTISDCVDQCHADEYAVGANGRPAPLADGGWTTYPQPDLPSSCRFLTADPGGDVYSCCPCE